MLKNLLNKKTLLLLTIFFGVFFLFQLQANAYCCVGINNDSGDPDYDKIIASECKEIKKEDVQSFKPYQKACDSKYPSSSKVRYELRTDYTCCNINECAQSKNKPCPTPPSAAPAATQQQTTQPKGEPLKFAEPKLQIDIPTVKFSDIQKEGEYIRVPHLAEYVAGVFKYAVSIISIVAIVMIMVGGLMWLTAGGSAERVGKAKETITGAVLGLLLALGSYTVLYAINPDLVSFESLKVKIIEREIIQYSNEELSAKDTPLDPNEIVCKPATNYAGLEKMSRNELAGIYMIAKEPYLTPGAKNALKKAGEIAKKEGYSLTITSACRSLEAQQKIAAENPGKVGSFIATPGKSYHGTGKAVDAYLKQPDGKTMAYNASGNKIKGGINSKTQCQVDEKLSKKLAEIMFQAGWVRYEQEIWHFEYQSNKSGRISSYSKPSICK